MSGGLLGGYMDKQIDLGRHVGHLGGHLCRMTESSFSLLELHQFSSTINIGGAGGPTPETPGCIGFRALRVELFGASWGRFGRFRGHLVMHFGSRWAI